MARRDAKGVYKNPFKNMRFQHNYNESDPTESINPLEPSPGRSDAAKLTVNGGQAPCCSARNGPAGCSDHYCKRTVNHAGIGAPEICGGRIVHLVQVATGVVQKGAKTTHRRALGRAEILRLCGSTPSLYEPELRTYGTPLAVSWKALR
jgi:hypothetical protein